jgi:predicted Zn-dependent protease
MAAELAPVRSIERLKYAEYKAQTGAPNEAIGLLKTITKQAPDYLPAWCLLAQIAATDKKYDESLALLENVFSRDPENVDARMLQAQTFLAKNETQKALEGLERLDNKYPNIPSVRYQLARAYLQNNNQPQAISVLNQVATTNPNYSEAVLLLAELNLRTSNAQAVVTSMVDLLKKQPGSFPAQILLSEGYRSLGRLDDAAAIFRERIEAGAGGFEDIGGVADLPGGVGGVAHSANEIIDGVTFGEIEGKDGAEFVFDRVVKNAARDCFIPMLRHRGSS